MIPYTHLHVHTQYSILDGASDISTLIKKAADDGMPAVAITDHGNMFGAKEFFNTAKKNGIKAILGCETYVAKGSRFDRSDKTDRGYHLILLAKNKTGYHNLIKMVSYGFTEGFYFKPRIDKELLRKHHEGIICASACLGGEVPQAIMRSGKEAGLEVAREFQEIFGDDYYLEIQRHQSGDPQKDEDVYNRQVEVNAVILEIAKELGIKVIATNDVHFINAEDAEAHDRLICLNTGKDLDDPTRMRYTTQEFFKTQQEMNELFADVPESLETTNEIVEKVEFYELDSAPIMPEFELPQGFDNEDEYLRHLTYEGAKRKYPEITDEIRERIDFELSVIKGMGFPGYFLIVQDFLHAARNMGVSVGPGRGSAAGSAVAYCNDITDIDPIKYNLLFERFLNPDRISMPDIDIDFDEDGRERVLRWVVEKYGEKRVAHIVTFGTMAAKLAIRDVARVEKMPLDMADRLAKLVPEKPGTTIAKAYKEEPELKKQRDEGEDIVRRTLRYAETLEGSVRQTGVHACGIIIARDDLENYLPVTTAKDADLWVTQYDGSHVENVGMLKMDFLGLKTLSIIKDGVQNVKESKGIDIDIAHIPLDDAPTYELYARGETTGLFQFESEGMKKHLKALKPNRFEDLIAMNALYRPGPMEYIPSFIRRKHGQEKIEYDLPEMAEFLEDTYGITVYQEQVMLLSQKLANFTKGMADSLRKAMGKKKKDLMAELKEKFVAGCKENGYAEETVLKIWHDWEAFAQYAFNKSHSTCYAFVSYQTAYLKAHHPGEYMAAVLSRNINDIKKITIFMDECRRMGLEVLGPDVNESKYRFTVNKEGHIRFGLGAIKGVGEGAVNKIIEEREENGFYKDIYDFVERVNLHQVNKKNMEGLATAGAFDNLDTIKRGQYFATDIKEASFIENLVRYGNRFQNDKETQQQSLFGGDVEIEIAKPELPPNAEDWQKLERLTREKELVGIYLSAHPLDDFKLEIKHFVRNDFTIFDNLEAYNNQEVTLAALVTGVEDRITKTGKPYGRITLQDYKNQHQFMMFSKDWTNFRQYCYVNNPLFIRGKIQENRFREGELEFKFTQIDMLSELREERVNALLISIDINDLNDELMNEIKQYTTTNKAAKVQLKFKVYDREDKIVVDLFSRSQRVDLSNDFIDYLDQNSLLQYRIS